ncbi:enoyl-CoA hydratase-related protein [Marinobacter sp.]|uniref:enoyl-CoA hydratase-related protein n=1 Tax=Marinobacter sp. TaxID=50741 RepID=UPI0034A35B5A
MTTDTVLSGFDETRGIATLTFNRPEALNTINVAMARAFLDAVTDLKARDGLRAIVLTGSGRAFMAGGDIASMSGTPEQARQVIQHMLEALNPAITQLRSIDAPVIAAVRGAAAGAGLSLALSADLIIAEENARFLIGYNGIGAVPDCGGSWFLPHRIGATRAAEMMILGRTLTASEALEWGLINKAVAAAEFDDTVARTVDQVAAGPTRSFGAFRRLMDHADGNTLASHLEYERQAFLDITETADFQEGVAAFLAKRPARFQGR